MGCCAIRVIAPKGLREHLKELPYETLPYGMPKKGTL
jgi:hypothetical protein